MITTKDVKRMSGLVWIPKSEISEKKLQNDLRLIVEDFNSFRVVDQWKSSIDSYGVPRNYAFKNGYSILPVRQVAWDWGRPNIDSYRYNQEEVIEKSCQSLADTCGVLIEAPVAFGKTVISCCIAARMKAKTLVLVHKTDLIPQWRDTVLRFFGNSTGHIQGDICDTNHCLTVATIQTLYSRRDYLDLWNDFGMIICDESHRFPGEMFSTVVSHFPAQFRMGVSATWRRKDGLEPLWTNHISDNIVVGRKNDVILKYVQIPYQGMNDGMFYRGREISHTKCVTEISQDMNYNRFCAEGILAQYRKGKNILVVTHRIEQIRILLDLLKSISDDLGVYVGTWNGRQMKPDQLKASLEKRVILATFGKIAEGTDCPRLDTAFLLTPCTDPEQVVGRIARPFANKKEAIVYDLFPMTGYCRALATKRERVYNSMGMTNGKF